MGKKSAPKAPDYTKLAEQTAASNAAAAQQATQANRVNQVTPWGTSSWTNTPTTVRAVDQAAYDKAYKQWTKNRVGNAPTAADFMKDMVQDNWTQTVALTPAEQAALESQQRIRQGMSDTAEGMLGRVGSAVSNPYDPSGLPQGGSYVDGTTGFGQGFQGDPSVANKSFGFGGDIQYQLQGDPNQWRERAQQAVLDFQKPLMQEQQAALENKLANMGLARGSEAWNRESRNLADQQARAQLQAMDAGRAESNLAFNQMLGQGQFANAAQQQGYNQNLGLATFENAAQQQEFQNALAKAQQGDAEAMNRINAQIAAGNYNNQNRQAQFQQDMALRQMPLNEMNAFLSGQQINNPQFQNFYNQQNAGGVDYMGAGANQYQGAMDAYNARMGQMGNIFGTLGQLGSSAMMFSDRRLKRDEVCVGKLVSGLPIYTFRYWWSRKRHIGVMAQDVLRVIPDAVHKHWSGFLMVDYSKVN